MFAKMSPTFSFSIVHIALLLVSIRCISSAPIESIYADFLSDMNSSKCTTPEEIKIPSNSSTAENLSSYLNMCHRVDARNKEALYLCREIIDNLKLILCPPISVQVIANSGNITLSKEVCKDIAALKDAVPENRAVLKRLTDSFTCEIICEGIFEKACKVLLWSYQLRPQKGETESPNTDAKENPLTTEFKAVPDKTKQAEENKAIQKTAVTEQQIQVTGQKKQQSTNDVVSTLQKTVGTAVTQQAQNQTPGQPSTNLGVQSPSLLVPKDPSSNIMPLHQNNLVGNNSLDAGQIQLPQVEISGNDLPEKDIEPHDAGPAELEDPHDQAEPLSHNGDVNAQPPQNLDNKKPPGLPVADEASNLPNNQSPDIVESHLQAKLPQPNANEGLVEPHDGDEEELVEVERNETEQKPPVIVSQNNLQGNAENSNLNNEANQQPDVTIQEVATTKGGLTKATTKNAIATSQKKVVADVKTSPVGETQSTDGQKTAEHASPLPSQKESEVSSVASPTNQEASSILPPYEKMDEKDDAHEMPEDREPDQYRRIYEPTRNKEMLPDKPNEVEVSQVNMRPREPSFDDLSLGEKYGRQSVFPEQEDGHFFFYFLTIVLILMAGYMLFHNKQKIIALIVEGRHERRRRSHGVGYKKLETK